MKVNKTAICPTDKCDLNTAPDALKGSVERIKPVQRSSEGNALDLISCPVREKNVIGLSA